MNEVSTAFAVQGDVNDIRIARLGGVEDLTTVTAIEAHVWRGKGRAREAATLPASVSDAAQRLVAVNFGGVAGWLTGAAPARWAAEVQATWPDGSIITFPSPPGEAWVAVRDQGDPLP